MAEVRILERWFRFAAPYAVPVRSAACVPGIRRMVTQPELAMPPCGSLRTVAAVPINSQLRGSTLRFRTSRSMLACEWRGACLVYLAWGWGLG